MVVACEQEAQHRAGADKHQHKDAEKQAAAAAAILRQHGSVIVVAAFVTAARGSRTREAGVVPSTAPRANGHRGGTQVEARERAGRWRLVKERALLPGRRRCAAAEGKLQWQLPRALRRHGTFVCV